MDTEPDEAVVEPAQTREIGPGRAVVRKFARKAVLKQTKGRFPAPVAALEVMTETANLRIPEALDRLVVDCLAKDPDARPQSAREIIQRLSQIEECLAPWTQDDAIKWWETHSEETEMSNERATVQS